MQIISLQNGQIIPIGTSDNLESKFTKFVPSPFFVDEIVFNPEKNYDFKKNKNSCESR